MITRKKGLTVRDWVLASLMFSGIFAMGVIALTGYANEAGNTDIIDPTLESHYNQLQQNLGDINSSLKAVSTGGGLDLTGGLQILFTSTISVVNIVLGSLAQLPLLFINFASDFGIPTAVSGTFMVILLAMATVVVVFAILNSVKQGARV